MLALWGRLAVLVLSFGSGAYSFASGEQACTPLSEATKQSLSRYVKEKYRLAFEITAEAGDGSPVAGTCYRKIRFNAAPGEQRRFAMSLYLSPDQRFLSKELMDVNIDPILAEEHDNTQLLKQLTPPSAASLGPETASVTITLFSDFQCPFCKREWTVLKSEVATQPNVRIVLRQLPLPMHDWSRAAAEATSCAALQSNGAFWKATDYLFEHQSEMNAANVIGGVRSYLQSKGLLDGSQFDSCLAKKQYVPRLDADLAFANEHGIESTPTIFINSIRIEGAVPAEQILTVVQQLEERTRSQQGGSFATGAAKKPSD